MMPNQSEYTEQVLIRLTKADKRRLEQLAAEQERPPGVMARLLLRDILQLKIPIQPAA